MHEEPSSTPAGSHNPRNNPRQHKKPTRRSAAPTQHLSGSGPAPAASNHAAQSAAASTAGSPSSAPQGRQRHEVAASSLGESNGAARRSAHQAPQAASPAGSSAQAPASSPSLSPEAAARAAYDEYAAVTEQPYPGSATAHGAQRHGGYAGYAATNPRVNPARKTTDQAAPYADYTRYTKKPKKKAGIVSVILTVVILGAIGAGVFLYLNPPSFNTVVNGMTCTVDSGTTVADLIADGVVSPEPGNLVAVDGEVIEEGKGTPFTATINGEEVVDPATAVHKNDTVQISAGTDIMEDYDAKTVEKKPKTTTLGEGAIHAIITGESGTVEKRTGKISGKTVKEVTKPVVNNTYFSYNANTGDDKVIALTFDDGPWPTTNELLDVLKEYDVKATFFTIGEQIADYPDAMKREVKEGHQITTHTWDHASGSGNGVDLTLMSPEEQVEEVTKGQEAVTSVTGGEAPTAFRAPGGNFHDDIIWNVAPYVSYEIGWNVDTEDWRTPGADVIADRIMSAKSGDIVLMHDGGGPRTQTIEALKIALPKMIEKGYKFVTIDELLAYDDAKALAEEAQKAQDAQDAAE